MRTLPSVDSEKTASSGESGVGAAAVCEGEEGEGGGVGIPIPRKSKRSTHVCRLTITDTELKSTST